MPVRNIRAAARQSLRDASESPRKLTLLYALCLNAPYLAYTVIDAVLYSAMDTTSGGIGGFNGYAAYLAVVTLASVLISVFASIWQCNYQNLALNISRGKEVSFRDITAPFRIFWKVFCLNFMIGIYTALWSLLFYFPIMAAVVFIAPDFAVQLLSTDLTTSPLIYLIMIPGMIVAYRYRLAFLILFDHEDWTASQALEESKRLTRGYKWDLFRLDLSFIWYSVLVAAVASLLPQLLLGSMETFRLVPYLVCSVIPLILEIAVYTLFLAYVETSDAHAYNFILHQQQTKAYAADDFPVFHGMQGSVLQEPEAPSGQEAHNMERSSDDIPDASDFTV